MTLTQGKFNQVKRSKSNGSFFAKKESSNRLFFQPKLTVGPVDDVYEREADAVSDQVMQPGMPKVNNTTLKPSISMVQPSCAGCREEEKNIQKKKMNNRDAMDNSLSLVDQTLISSGQSIDENSRAFMERKIGYDFSRVNIHTGPEAAKSAQSINALAYTSGNNIFFNEGQYAPRTEKGKKLLAHELTHVVQQTKAVNDIGLIQRACDHDFSEYSGSECEGTIHVGATTISSPLIGYYHLFVLYTDSTGSQFYFRGGPGGSESGYGNIITSCAPYVEGEIEYNPRNLLEEVYQGTDACDKVNVMQNKLNEIEGWNVPYVPAGPNSNSIIATLLKASGLPHRKPAVPAPGFEMEVTPLGAEEISPDRPTLFLLSYGGGNGFLLNAEVQQRLHTFSPRVGDGIPIPIPLQLNAGFYTLPVQGRFGGSIGLSTDISIFNLPLWAFSPLGITFGGGFTAGGIRTEEEPGVSNVSPEIGGYARAGIYTDIDRLRISPQYQFNALRNTDINSTTTLHTLIIQLGYTF